MKTGKAEGNGKYEFDFERLEVSQKAVDFANKVYSVVNKESWFLQSTLGNQFVRASLSICNNLAEGSRKSSKDRVRFYEYSLDSARECIPMITLLTRQAKLEKESVELLREDCARICRMLVGLIKSVT